MGSLAHLNKYLYQYKWLIVMGALFIVLSNGFKVYMPSIIDQAIDQLTQESNSTNLLFLGFKVFGLYMLFSVISGLFLFLTRQTIIVASRNIEYDLKNEIYNKYQLLSLNFYKKNATGDLMNRISEDVGHVRMYLGPAIMYTLNVATLFVMILSFMFSKNLELSLYVLAPLPIMSVLVYKISKLINQRSEKTQFHQSALSTFVQEVFSGIRVLKAFNRTQYFEDKFVGENESYQAAALKLARTNALFSPVIILLIGVSTILTIYIGGLKSISGQLDIGDITQFVIYVNLLTWPFASIGWVSSIIQRAAASQKRINEFLEAKELISNCDHPQTISSNSIKFKKVSFTYDVSDINAIKDTDLSINPGETVGITGKTGSGKSTFANLLCRLYDVNSGQIEIGDVDIRKLDKKYLRSKIGYVPQEDFLFSDTILNNIAFGTSDELTEEEAIILTKITQVHENIIAFPKGYQTKVGERGITLSGGQKQRIAIARALASKPEILVLDDCLSAVDVQTEENILNNLKQKSKDRITIIISHRVNTLLHTDKIFVLDSGSITDIGTHEHLTLHSKSYRALMEAQTE